MVVVARDDAPQIKRLADREEAKLKPRKKPGHMLSKSPKKLPSLSLKS